MDFAKTVQQWTLLRPYKFNRLKKLACELCIESLVEVKIRFELQQQKPRDPVEKKILEFIRKNS